MRLPSYGKYVKETTSFKVTILVNIFKERMIAIITLFFQK